MHGNILNFFFSLRYTDKMFAFVPGKDVLLFLAKIQKKIISVFNSNRPAKFFAAPVFPLWAFFDFAFPEKIISCEFLEPVFKDEKFIFPVKIISLKDVDNRTYIRYYNNKRVFEMKEEEWRV